jgi:hypothetical protein
MTRLFAAALLALAFSPHAWAADPTPRQNYPTSADHGVAITVVPMGIDVNGFAVPCGSSTVVTGCGIGGAPSAVVTSDTRATASLAAGTLNATVSVALNGSGTVAFSYTGLTASAATLTAEASDDAGTTWAAVNCEAPATGALTTTITVDGQCRINAAGRTNARLRVSTAGSGTVTVVSNVSAVPGLVGLSAPIPVAPLSYTTTTTATVATASGTLATVGQYKFLNLCTLPTSTANVWLNPNGAAVANTGIPIFAGGGCTSFGTQGLPMPTTAITAITDGGSAQTITLAGG